MKTNLKHIELEFINEENFKDSEKLDNWLLSVNVSSKSKFIDNEWHFDGCELYAKALRSINWDKKTKSGYFIKDYPDIFINLKKIIYFLGTTLVTRKKHKSLSQIHAYLYFRHFIDWMINNKIYSFNVLNKSNFNQYIEYIKNEKCKKNNRPLNEYLNVFNYLYTYKGYLRNSLQEDFFDGKAISDFFNYKGHEKEQTKRIPNEILEKIINKITPIIDYFCDNEIIFENILNQNVLVKPKLLNKLQSMTDNKKKEYNTIILNSIAYFTIGLYTGMRISEILSLKKECYEIDENGVIVLNSKLFKFANNEGRPEKWGCGLNSENNYALKALKMLSKLSPHKEDLFFMYKNNQFYPLLLKSLNNYLNDLMEFCEVNWDISSHQLRRTFATLIGITDKTSLLALKEHFKHASITMTNYYVGSNLELLGIINEEKQLEISQGLESILSTDKLAGKLGEKIAKSNLSFRGSIEARKNYINSIINESDLIIVPHEYGFCLYQPEQAKCKGENKNIGLNTCQNCNNFVVSPKHKVFWLNRIEQYEDFKKQIANLPNQELTIKELDFTINETQIIINKISTKE